MDDFKLMASTRKQLQEFSTDVRMQFGLDKYRTVNIVRGEMGGGDFELQDWQSIETMREEDNLQISRNKVNSMNNTWSNESWTNRRRE